MVKGVWGLATALVLCATPAFAQTTGSITVGTDYVSRGTSQTYGRSAGVLYVDHQFKSGFYVSGVAADVDFDDDAFERAFGDDGTYAELDAFGGYRGKAGKISYDVGVASINYLGAKKVPEVNPGGNWNMVEFYGKLSTTVKGVDLGFTLGLDPDYFNNYGRSTWTEVTVGAAVTPKLYVGGGFGRQQFYEKSSTGIPAKYSNYNTWNVGASYSATPHLTLDVRYYDNDTKIDLGRNYKPRMVISARRSF